MEKPSLIEKLKNFDPVPEHLLGVFVKAPVAGQVKTRLCPPLQPQEAAALYEVALLETINRFSSRSLPLVLFYAGAPEYFQQKFPEHPLWPQNTGDLGQRMHEALSLLLETGCRSAALIGSDSPDLPLTQVDAAFAALVEHQAVTIPADDGGYVLVGCSGPCPELFTDISWSTSAVLAETRQQAEQNGYCYAEVGGWYDVDDQVALQALLQRTPESATARFIRQHLPHLL